VAAPVVPGEPVLGGVKVFLSALSITISPYIAKIWIRGDYELWRIEDLFRSED
jgi:hypothetical protein